MSQQKLHGGTMLDRGRYEFLIEEETDMIEAFKNEIIEAEKSRIDLLKWKLIIVAALSAVGLGIGPNVSPPKDMPISLNLALALVPLVATYVDLLCRNLQLRIFVISEYFQKHYSNTTDQDISLFISYEKFCEKVRSAFNLEDWAQVGSTIVLSILVLLVPFFLKPKDTKEFCAFLTSGGIGLISSLFIYFSCKNKVRILKGMNNFPSMPKNA